MDRNGDGVGTFPVSIETSADIKWLGVIDYAANGKWRIAATTANGEIFLLNKEGKVLDGWNPRVMPDKQVMALKHIRVRNRDYLITASTEGAINVLKRNGTFYDGFPAQSGGRLESEVFVKKGTSPTSSSIRGVTRNGEYFHINFLGKISSQKQLPRNAANSKFVLVPDASGKQFVFASHDELGITVFNNKGQELFTNNSLISREITFQYYQFTTGNQFFIHDREHALLYGYTANGKMLKGFPASANFPVSLMVYNKEGKQLYRAHKNQLFVDSL